MGWDHGGQYYTRSRRVNGRVVREYIGAGRRGREAFDEDIRRRRDRERQKQVWIEERELLEDLDRKVAQYFDGCEMIANAAITAAGYHNHRGHWRRKRG